eukprot:42093-Eustigmatos_ZCMA.PRE.1
MELMLLTSKPLTRGPNARGQRKEEGTIEGTSSRLIACAIYGDPTGGHCDFCSYQVCGGYGGWRTRLDSSG